MTFHANFTSRRRCLANMVGLDSTLGNQHICVLCNGEGIAWLPKTLVAPDIEAGLLIETGLDDWQIDLDIRLLRQNNHTNKLTRDIWAFLSTRQLMPLLGKNS